MKALLIALAVLALAPVAQAARATAGPVTMISRDVPLGRTSGRSLAAALPRFNMVALHWQGSGTPYFRTRATAGRWSAWQAADDDWGRSGPWRKQGNPSWTGTADQIQYRLRGRVTRLRAYLLWSGPEQLPQRRLALAGGPTIVPRSGWGADEEIRRAPPAYADAVRFALVHHTVNANSYTAAQSAAIVRGIELYHVRGNGWNDIGYNFLVDRYGQVFEGRYGGIDQPVVGAHSAGFNTGSVGIAVIGTFATATVPAAAKTALEQLLAWRLDVAHVDPLSTVTVASGGNSKFRAGTQVQLRAVSGHRDTYLTECPGQALYGQLPAIAKAAAAIGLPKLYAPLVTGGVGGPVRFAARLSGPLPWTVTVTDATGTVVATGSGTGANVDWTWDATAAAPGSYAWTIAAGPSVRPATGRLGAKPAVLAITGAGAAPAVTASTTQISYTLSAPATVVATLLDVNGVEVAPLFTEARPAGRQTFAYTVAPTVVDGPYTIQLVAQTVDGRQATAAVPIQVDRTVADFSAAPGALSPNGDGVQDTLAAYFLLAQSETATLAVVQNGVPLATLLSGFYTAGTPVTAGWDGTANGVPVPDGTYTLALTDGAVTHTLPLVVDRRPPALRPVSWRRLRFSVDEPATVMLTAGGRSYVKNVTAAGKLYFWLRTLPRHYVVQAQDAAGNVTALTR